MNEHNLLLARHTAYEYRDWVKIDMIQTVSQVPWGLASIERVV